MNNIKSQKIVVIGSVNTDMVVKTDVLPLPGETKLGEGFIMNAGGKGANQAVTVARLGGDITFIAKVGNDIFGKYSILGLKKEQINTDSIFVDQETPSGIALIMVDRDGENSILVAPGANFKLFPEDIYQVKNIITEADIILIQMEIPLITVSNIIEIANIHKKKVILNPAPAQKLNNNILNGLFLITPNESEASLLTGINVHDEATAFEAAQAIKEKGVNNVIITMGSQGALLLTETIAKIIPANKVKVVDTTAAGDVFNGSIAVAISEGKSLKDSIVFANHVSAISVTRLGAQISIPYRNEILF